MLKTRSLLTPAKQPREAIEIGTGTHWGEKHPNIFIYTHLHAHSRDALDIRGSLARPALQQTRIISNLLNLFFFQMKEKALRISPASLHTFTESRSRAAAEQLLHRIQREPLSRAFTPASPSSHCSGRAGVGAGAARGQAGQRGTGDRFCPGLPRGPPPHHVTAPQPRPSPPPPRRYTKSYVPLAPVLKRM